MMVIAMARSIRIIPDSTLQANPPMAE